MNKHPLLLLSLFRENNYRKFGSSSYSQRVHVEPFWTDRTAAVVVGHAKTSSRITAAVAESKEASKLHCVQQLRKEG